MSLTRVSCLPGAMWRLEVLSVGQGQDEGGDSRARRWSASATRYMQKLAQVVSPCPSTSAEPNHSRLHVFL